MEKERSEELILWVIISSRRSGEANQPTETNFVYAANDEDANEILERWKELHLEYEVQSYKKHPDGITKDGLKIEGKKRCGEC